jgi:hypothetical protein
MVSECLSDGPDQSMLSDMNTGFRNFFSGLEGVSAIGKKRTARCLDEQERSAATETAEITNVGEKRNQEYVRANSGEETPEPVHPIR